MSLDFNLREIPNHREMCWNGDNLAPITHNLVWATIGVGLGAITEKNLPEWLFRLEFLNRIGCDLGNLDKPALEAHIGLSCNVIDESRAKFIKRHIKGVVSDIEWAQRPKH